jgi:hypothetical protein
MMDYVSKKKNCSMVEGDNVAAAHENPPYEGKMRMVKTMMKRSTKGTYEPLQDINN